MASDELTQRYGRTLSRGRRRALIGVGVAVLTIAIGYAAWYALTIGNPKVTWQDIGYQNTADGVDVTFEVTFSPRVATSDAAVCTVEALNNVRTVIGTQDITVSPASDALRTVRVTVPIRTSELANTGLVDTCVLQ